MTADVTRPDVLLVTVECARADDAAHLAPDGGGEAKTAVVPGHYTRPSLAGVLSGQYRAAASADLIAPTLPGVLSDAGYTTIGVCHSPQAAVYSCQPFDDNQISTATDDGPLARGSRWRKRLARLNIVQRAYRYVRPKSATLDRVQPDGKTVADAIDAYRTAEAPRFLWVHLMDSHRPYGRGDDALPDGLGRRAARTTDGLPQADHNAVRRHYLRGLQRASDHLDELLNQVGPNTEWVVLGDHGEELGEGGYYFHSAVRRRTADALVEVPVWTSLNLEAGLLAGVDVAPLLTRAVGVGKPDDWDGNHRGSSVQITLAPWGDQTSVRVGTDGGAICVADGSASVAAGPGKKRNIQRQLAALGYR